MSRTPKTYSPREEFLNVATHAAGIVFAMAATVLLCRKAALFPDALGAWIYGLSMAALFAGSTFYHKAFDPEKRAKLRLFDHSAIYLLIAGTYTPLMLTAVPTPAGRIVLAVVWFCAVIGITFELLQKKPFKGFSIVLYLISGWACVAIMPQLYAYMGMEAFLYLLGGGVAYTAGVPFYLSKKEFAHALWHVFVLAGAALQFVAIYLAG